MQLSEFLFLRETQPEDDDVGQAQQQDEKAKPRVRVKKPGHGLAGTTGAALRQRPSPRSERPMPTTPRIVMIPAGITLRL